jgi:3-oxoacyl-[acyl-carrier-protein] synthase-3
MISAIQWLNAYLPPEVVDNAAIESRIQFDGNPVLPAGSLERIFGIRERRFAAADVQVSDLACAAAEPLFDCVPRGEIDCLIFAAACADLIEPATANIIQQKLQLACPVFDVKNACNSFTSGIQVADALICNGTYRNVLVVNGEKLSDTICFSLQDTAELKRRIAAYSLGDAGAAALLAPSADNSGIRFQRFRSAGQHWKLCTIQGGGSMFPFDATKHYFEGQTLELTAVIQQEAKGFLDECLEASGWTRDDISMVFTHQVSERTFRSVADFCGLPEERFHKIFSHCGNTAAASIPLALHDAQQRGMLQKGQKIMLIGLAAGVSISVQLMVW